MQSRVFQVGARSYNVISEEATTDREEYTFRNLQEILHVKNDGDEVLQLRCNDPANDTIEIDPGEERVLPIKTTNVFVQAKDNTTKFRIIGYRE